ncbi:MAG: S8 family serine peptidase, partial [Actinomycetota bacterium]|nr:S8 family serine peptidase [Actinomycetota bacterium]
MASTASALLAVVFIDPAAAQTVPETSAPETTISDPEATTAVESTGDVPTGTTTPSTPAVLVVPSTILPPPVSTPPQTTLAAPEESAPPASTPGTTEVTSASTTTPATTTSAPPPVLTVLSGPDPCLTGCDLGTGLIFRQWHLEPLGVTTPPSISAEGALIAVVDGGIRLDHPDLIGNVRRPACAPGVNSDLHLEHGTNVAGLIAPISFDAAGLGPAVPGITILDIPIVGFDGEGRTIASAAVVAAGVRCAVAEGADVINLSITGSCADADELQAAIAEAELAGAVVVAAAGNASLLAPPCPAAFDTVLSAGATSEAGDVAIG